MAKQDIAIKVLQQVVKLPVVKVNREKFLVEKFSKELDKKDIAKLLEQGPPSLLPQETLDRVARSCIKDNVLRARNIYSSRSTWRYSNGAHYSN